MKPLDVVMTLEIDGKEVDVGRVQALAQSDPYPDGHCYVLHIRGPRAREPFRGLGLKEHPDSRSTVELFYTLGWLLHARRSPEDETDYFLNTVSDIVVTDTEVTIHGICSQAVTNVW